MAEHLEAALMQALREESEHVLREADYPPETVVVRPNLRAEHTVILTEDEERKLADEARRRQLSEDELMHEWIVQRLASV